jgi:hypothetical protein
MNVDRMLVLINNKKTTIEEVIAFIYKDIEFFQKEREDFYIKEFKNQNEGSDLINDEDYITDIAERITNKLEIDTKKFVCQYVNRAVDDLLDAFNSKKVTMKKGFNNIIILLTQIKDNFSEKDV